MRLRLITALAALALAAAAPLAQAQIAADGSTAEVKDWDVLVDLPTGFAYVKTPQRWVFVRQLSDEQLDNLPATTLVSLLSAEELGETRLAYVMRRPSRAVATR
jgi:hypothetical protein